MPRTTKGTSALRASARTHVQVRAAEHLVHLEDVRAAEHLARRAARVGFGEVLALGPGDEVLEGPPPGLHLVVALRVRVLRPGAALVLELHRPRAVHLVADEPGMAVDEVDAPLEAVLEVDLMAAGDGTGASKRSLARGTVAWGRTTFRNHGPPGPSIAAARRWKPGFGAPDGAAR